MRQNSIKMVAFDLDGTLLSTQKTLTEYTKKVLSEAARKGIILVPATGRPFVGVPKEVKALAGVRYAITANGSRILDTVSQEVVYEKLLPQEIGKKVLDIFEQYDTLREVSYDGQAYSEEKMRERVKEFEATPWMTEYILSTRIFVEDIRKKEAEENRPFDKVQAAFLTAEDKAKALCQLADVEGIEATGSISNNIEVSAKGVNKGEALLWLARFLGVEVQETMALGDSDNDKSMLLKAGLGVAMANASDVARDAADVITDSNDEDGAAKAIEKYAL